jgi:hypothetical protein
MRVRLRRLGVPATLLALLGCGLAATAAQAAVDAPLVSAVSTSTDSWVTLPMGDLSDPSTTFWELFHAASGSSHWSLVTPPGVADNGGLVQSSSAGAALVGVLPSDLLRFSPLAQSADGGGSWVPAFLPGALAPVPDALAYDAAPPGERHRTTGWGPCAERAGWPLVVVSSGHGRRAEPGVSGLQRGRARRRRTPAERGTADRHRLPTRWARRPVHADCRSLAERRAHPGQPTARSGHHRAPGAVDGSNDDRAHLGQPWRSARSGGAVAER